MTLTHWGQDKMATILQTTFAKCTFVNEKFPILYEISMRYVPLGLIENIPTVAQIMAWHRTDRPLS